jgi:hypothetical protein
MASKSQCKVPVLQISIKSTASHVSHH